MEGVLINSCKECSSYQTEDEHGCEDVCLAEWRLIDNLLQIPEWCLKRKRLMAQEG
jgi:hypothetical protein